MCLIIHSEKTAKISENLFWEATTRNKDGFGFMSKSGVFKTLDAYEAFLYLKKLQQTNEEFCIHFRKQTAGDDSLENCHPFQVPGTEVHMMHNGTLQGYAYADTKYSDSLLFATSTLSGLGRLSPTLGLEHAEVRNLIEDATTGSKMAFLLEDGRIITTFKASWTGNGEGLFFSNLYSFNTIYMYI
jgi:predicted glutamine amidotransferase